MPRLVVVLFILVSVAAQADVFDDHPIQLNERGYLFEMHGSNTIGAALAPALIQSWLVSHGFEQLNSRMTSVPNERIISARSPTGDNIQIFVAAHGSGTGFAQIQAGHADIAAASRPAKDSENALFPDVDVTTAQSELVLAIDGIAVIVHPALDLESLSIQQIGQLFSGQIQNWNQIGGPNLPVSVHARDNQSGTYDTFNTLVLKRGYDLTADAARYESNDVLSATVSSTPGAIGFTSLASIGEANAVAVIDGDSTPMRPQNATIATEDYPLARRLYLYEINSANAFVLDFLRFARSQAGQQVVAQTGFVSQNLQSMPMPVSGTLPAGYTFISENSERITTNFRFRPGTNHLDNKAMDDLDRLAAFMARPENKDRKLILIGFSDQQNNEFRAQLVSEARVIQVKRALAEKGIQSSALTGYGHLNPVASNVDPKYALRNQRIEVWIR
ncbi:substrate-binding domain-containing protein [Reinekea blandensis]|uniref:ABC-type phosphate transport system, periplasmic component n=1 Tax=Reinekea blandensis MED297 TaxID=314283 RepID=A4BDX7_9GAMM|nr:phosphate ABC transporter substrate-binding/OmpA family protein [Reinekea blandensis]EAR09736.1 ABC-type phosphate transport system, periplasmic component [Reinekea blandensis MED297]